MSPEGDSTTSLGSPDRPIPATLKVKVKLLVLVYDHCSSCCLIEKGLTAPWVSSHEKCCRLLNASVALCCTLSCSSLSLLYWKRSRPGWIGL